MTCSEATLVLSRVAALKPALQSRDYRVPTKTVLGQSLPDPWNTEPLPIGPTLRGAWRRGRNCHLEPRELPTRSVRVRRRRYLDSYYGDGIVATIGSYRLVRSKMQYGRTIDIVHAMIRPSYVASEALLLARLYANSRCRLSPFVLSRSSEAVSGATP